MPIVIQIFLITLAAYFGIGLLFGLYFLFWGAPRVDPLMADSKKKVRLLLFPGVVATWPFLMRNLFKTKTS